MGIKIRDIIWLCSYVSEERTILCYGLSVNGKLELRYLKNDTPIISSLIKDQAIGRESFDEID